MTDSRDTPPLVPRLVKRLVRVWRRVDARFNRPSAAGRGPVSMLIRPAGVVWYMPLLGALAVSGIALGPSPRFGMPQILLLCFGLVGLGLVHLDARRQLRPHPDQRHRGRPTTGHAALGRLCAGYLLVLLALVGLLVTLAGAETYATPGLQLHVGAAIVVAVTFGLTLAGWISARLLRIAHSGTRPSLAPTLAEIDLFSPRERYTPVGAFVWPTAALVALMRYPDRILLPAALLMLFLDEPARDILGRGWQGELWLMAAVTGLTWALMTLGLIHERLLEMLETLGRIFFIGPQRLVTWLVIAVALLRLMGNHYISYLFDGGNAVLVLYILAAYVTACFYGFWCDLLLARCLLPLLADDPGPQPSYGYTVCPHPETPETGADAKAAKAGPTAYASSVLPHGRSIALHGAGRFKIEGVHDDTYAREQGIDPRALAFLTAQQLTSRLRAATEDRDDSDALTLARDVQRGTAIYPPLMAALAFIILGVPGYIGLTGAIQPAALEIRPAPSGGSFDLAAALEGREHPASSCQPPAPGAPRIALALSGGGTRAAMHGYAVLRGLASEGQICNVIALSGVSGGAAALGYFAAHQGELRTPELNPKAWDRFGQVMADAFIDGVLSGQSSLRVAYGRLSWRSSACAETPRENGRVEGWYPPARTRSGNILAEDFVCTFGAATTDELPFGVIFNASLVGRFDTGNATACADPTGTLPARALGCSGQLDGSVAGYRLALTNLPLLGEGPDLNAVNKEDRNKVASFRRQANWLVVLNQPGISVARAAAASANFPPVFPDTPIDVTADGRNGQRYWVTDGGVIENRGYATLLLALTDAVSARPKVAPIGPLYVIVADASAPDARYTESRGFRSMAGAGSRLSAAMESLLARTLKKELAARNIELHFQSLTMPRMLVSVIGTHWRLPGRIVIGDPQQYGQGAVGALRRAIWTSGTAEPSSVALRGPEIAGLVECLYSRDIQGMTGLAPDKTANALRIMAYQDQGWNNGAAWRNLLSSMKIDDRQGLCGGLGPQAKALSKVGGAQK